MSDKENILKPVNPISPDQSKKLFDLVAPDLGLNNYDAFHEKLTDENLAKQFLGILNDRYENSFGDFDQFYSQLKKKDAPDLTAGYLKFDFASPKPSEQPDPGLSLDTVDEKITALDKLNEGLRREREADYGSLVPGLGEQFARKELDRKWEKSEALKNYDTQRKELLSQKLAEVGLTPDLITAKMSELQDQLKQAKYDLSKSNLTGAELMVAASGAKDPFDQQGQNLEMRAELARKALETKKKTQSAIEFMKLADKLVDPAQQREGLAALTKGLGSVLLKDFMTAGISEVSRMIDVADVSKKMEKGEPVSEEEKNLMEAYGIFSEIEKDPSRSVSAGVGRGVSSMIPYIMQFAITNGAAAPVRAFVTKALTKGIAKEGIGMVSKGALLAGKITQPVAKLAGSMAGAAVQTPLMPGTYTELNRRLSGEVTKEGEVVEGTREPLGKAIKNAGLTWYSEVFTEDLGRLAITPLLKGIRGKLKLSPSKIPNRIEKATGFDRLFPEEVEEVVNAYLQPALTGDKKLSEVWDNKEQLVTVLTVGMVGGVYYGINKASTGIDNAALARLYRIDDDTKEKVNSVLKKSTTTEMATELTNLFKSGEYSPAEIIDITKYTVGRLARMVGAEDAKTVGVGAAEEMKKKSEVAESAEAEVVVEEPVERAAPMEPIPPKPAEPVREISPSDQSKIAMLALRISEGEQITKPEDLDLQQTYPAELESALSELKPKENETQPLQGRTEAAAEEVVEPAIVKTTQVDGVGEVEKSVAEPQKSEPKSVTTEQKLPSWAKPVTTKEATQHQRGYPSQKIYSIEDALVEKDRTIGKKKVKISQAELDIKQGKITAAEAIEIIESAGLAVPESIQKLRDKQPPEVEPTPAETGPTPVGPSVSGVEMAVVPEDERLDRARGLLQESQELVSRARAIRDRVGNVENNPEYIALKQRMDQIGEEIKNIRQGKPVPVTKKSEPVETDKTEVSEPGVPIEKSREPWQMTREEYVSEKMSPEQSYKGQYLNPISHKYESRSSVENSFATQWFDSVVQAMRDGKKIPDHVKPSWAKTRQEYLDDQVRRMKEAKNPDAESFEMEQVTLLTHRQDVEMAIEKGLPVPEKVLAGYPELKQSNQSEKNENSQVGQRTPGGGKRGTDIPSRPTASGSKKNPEVAPVGKKRAYKAKTDVGKEIDQVTIPDSDLDEEIRYGVTKKNVEISEDDVLAIRAMVRQQAVNSGKTIAEITQSAIDEYVRLKKGAAKPLKLTPDFNEKPDGSSVTDPHRSYDESVAAKPGDKSKNLWVRQTKGSSNKNRILLVQFSSDLLNGGRRKGVSSMERYYDKLYRTRGGYDRTFDFWEIPLWIARISGMTQDADVYVIRDMDEAKGFFKTAGYKTIAFSALDINDPYIVDIAKSVPGQKISVGGYIELGKLKSEPNITIYNSVEEFADQQKLAKTKYCSYRHFANTRVIPRLKMSSGCRHICTFCTVPKEVVPLSQKDIDDQIDSIRDMDTRLVYLDDKTFGQADNYESLTEIYDKIKQFNPDFDGFIIQTTSTQVNRFTDKFLQDSHIRYVELGVETYNDDILEGLKKNQSKKKHTDPAVEKLRKNGINFIPNIVVGFKEETKKTYENTKRWLLKNADVISHINVYNLALYKGTELFDSIEVKIESDQNENLVKKSFHTNPAVHEQAMEDFTKIASDMLDRAELTEQPKPVSEKPTGTPIFQDLQAKVESIQPGENTTTVAREVGRSKDKLKPSEYSNLLGQLKPKQDAYIAEQIRLQKVRSGLVSSALKKFSQSELSDQVEKTKKALRDSMGTATMGFDPKALIELAKLTRMYVQNGVVDFVDFVKQIQGVWGDGFSKIEAFLPDMWEQVTGKKPGTPKVPDNSGKKYAEGGRKARLTVSNTLMNAGGSLSEEASRQIALGTVIAMYDPQNTEEASGLAMQLIESLGGIESATPTLTRKTGALSELPINQIARAIAIQYYSEVIENPKTSKQRSEEASKTRLDLIGIMAEEATFSGRANAFLQNFNSMTPEGLVIDYQNRINITARQAASRDKNFQEEARLFEDAVKNLPELVERLVNENKELRDRIKAAEQRATIKRENVYKERAKKEAQFRDEFIKTIDRSKLTVLTAGGINPYLLEVIGKLGASYVRQGILEMEAIAKEVKDFLKSNDIDLPDQDILDALEASTVKQEAEIESQSDRAKKIAGQAKAGQIRDIVRASLQNQGNLKDKLVKGLMEDAGFVREDATELAAEIETIITAKVEALSESIVRKQLTPKEKAGTPMATKMRTKVDQLLDMVKMGAFDKRDLIPLFKEKWGLRDMTDEEMEKIKEYGVALSKMLPGTIKNKTIIEFTDFMSNIIKKDKWNRFADTWIELNYLSMLSGVSTAIVNTIGPAMSLVFRPLAGMTNVGKWFNAARKAKKDGKFDVDTFRAENPMLNVLLYVNSVVFGFKQGGKAWTDIMEHGVSDSKFIETRKRSRVLDVPETERHAFKRSWKGALTAPVRWITRNLSAMDMLMTTTIFESQMAGMLQKEKLKGKTYQGWKNVMDELIGRNLDAEVVSGIRDIAASEAEEFQKVTGRPMRQREIDMRIRELIIDNIDPSKENSEMANAIARDNVFRNKRWGLFGHLAHSIGMVTNSSRIAKIATLPHIPFLEIVANVLDYMIDYTPLYGLVRPMWSFDRLIPSWSGKNAQLGEKGSDLYYEQLARGYFGTIAFFTLLALTIGDGDDEDWDQNAIIVTGPMTKWGDKYTKKDQWLKPYSIHFRKKDGTYFDINYLYIPQLSIPLGIIGELNDRIHTDKNPKGAEQWFKTIAASTNVVPQLMMDMSFVDGVNRLAELVTQLFAKIEAGEPVSEDTFKYLAKSYLGLVTNPLPQNWNIFNQIEKSIWPESRSKKSIEEILIASAGLHYINNKIVDIFGNPIKSYPGERQFDWPNWFGLTQTDPKYRFLIENNAMPQSMKNQAVTFYYGDTKTTKRTYTPDEYLEVATTAGKYFSIYVDNLMKSLEDDDIARMNLPALTGEKQKTLAQKSIADAWSEAQKKAKADFMNTYRISDRARKEMDQYLKQFSEK